MKDRVDLSFLLIGKAQDLNRIKKEISEDVQTLLIADNGENAEVAPATLMPIVRTFGPIIVLALLALLFVYGIELYWLTLLGGIYFGILLFGDLYEEGPLERVLRRYSSEPRKASSNELVPARVLRFFGCQNQVYWTANRIFNNTQGRVVVVAEGALQKSCQNALSLSLIHI